MDSCAEVDDELMLVTDVSDIQNEDEMSVTFKETNKENHRKPNKVSKLLKHMNQNTEQHILYMISQFRAPDLKNQHSSIKAFEYREGNKTLCFPSRSLESSEENSQA